MAGEIIRPSALPPRADPVASEVLASDNGSVVGGITLTAAVNAGRPLASEAEAVAGVEATKAMTPLTTKQAIQAQGDVRFASAAQGALANTAVQPGDLGTAASTDASDYATAAQGAKADTALQSVVAGTNVTVDNTDPLNPVVSASGGGGGGGETLLLALALSESVGTYIATGDQFADGFGSTGMVDVAGASNLDVSDVGYLKPSATAGGEAGTAPFGGGGGRGIGAGNGNNFALQFIAPADGSITSTKINVPNFTTAGTFEARLYTDNAGSPGTQVGVASASQSIAATGDKTFTFGTPPGIASGITYWMVFALVSGTPAFNVSSQANSGTSFKSGRGDVITAITDNLPSSEEWEVSIIYVGAAANLTVASEIIPCGYQPSGISGNVRVIPTDALTLNTDFMLDVSRNNGDNWSAATLALSFTDGGVSVLSFANVDLSGAPAASQPRYRIRSANNKNFKVDGTAVEFAP